MQKIKCGICLHEVTPRTQLSRRSHNTKENADSRQTCIDHSKNHSSVLGDTNESDDSRQTSIDYSKNHSDVWEITQREGIERLAYIAHGKNDIDIQVHLSRMFEEIRTLTKT